MSKKQAEVTQQPVEGVVIPEAYVIERLRNENIRLYDGYTILTIQIEYCNGMIANLQAQLLAATGKAGTDTQISEAG